MCNNKDNRDNISKIKNTLNVTYNCHYELSKTYNFLNNVLNICSLIVSGVNITLFKKDFKISRTNISLLYLGNIIPNVNYYLKLRELSEDHKNMGFKYQRLYYDIDEKSNYNKVIQDKLLLDKDSLLIPDIFYNSVKLKIKN